MRRWARTVALVLLVASARLPHLGQDDQACASLVSSGSSQDSSSFGAGSDAASQPEHCAICHWTRLLRSPLTGVGITITHVGPATLVLRGALPLQADPVHDHLPARAPPALL
jgi:hypothetical protein